LGTTSMWVIPAHSVALAVRRLADAIGRILTRGSGVTIPAREVARAVKTAEGTRMLRVVAFLFILLVLDESGEVIMGFVLTDSIADLLCQWVAVKESRKDGQTETDAKVSRNEAVAGRSD